MLFGRPPDAVMEVYNDFNSDLANVFSCVRDRPFALLPVTLEDRAFLQVDQAAPQDQEVFRDQL